MTQEAGALPWNPGRATLLDHSFLKDLTAEEYSLLERLFEPVEAAARTVIVRQGDQAEFLYLILAGKISLRYKPYDGPKITLTHLQAGDMFGWSAVVGHDRYTSDAFSTMAVQMVRLKGDDLRRVCRDHPDVGGSILEKLAKSVSPRWVHATKQIQVLLRQSMQVF